MSKILTLTLAALIAMPASAERCDVERRVKEDLDAAALTELRIDAMAGELIVRGQDADQVHVEAILCSDREESIEEMEVQVGSEGHTGYVAAIIPQSVRSGWTTRYAYIDLSLTVPRALALRIRDSSGEMRLSDVTLAMIDDSSGEINVRDSRGNLELSDSSGEISIRHHVGDLELSDSSGEIRLEEIEGKLHIQRDSSGDIDVRNLIGDLAIDRDGSGSIYIDQVEGGVTIDRDGSGSVEISRVRDDVRIGSDGSGDIRVRQVGGDFTVDIKGSGDIRVREVAGVVDTP